MFHEPCSCKNIWQECVTLTRNKLIYLCGTPLCSPAKCVGATLMAAAARNRKRETVTEQAQDKRQYNLANQRENSQLAEGWCVDGGKLLMELVVLIWSALTLIQINRIIQWPERWHLPFTIYCQGLKGRRTVCVCVCVCVWTQSSSLALSKGHCFCRDQRPWIVTEPG